ncbi:MAG TPA: WD40 repeat domain-containing serine/threonine protein kinase [Candidatus Polarisedimenticolia bacterium]|nr:WD40 repeat domain-containing serine/threonine protein kinase [Candidatus Polarisedimenticolia bacterium]
MNGRIIGHYRVLEKIGAGAMGEVFRARDERLQRDVALKLIRPGSSTNPDHIRRFELEARAAGALNHPNIVAIYDIGIDDKTPYIVCELLEGTTLRKRLWEGPLPVPLSVEYSLQIVRGLIAAHHRRVIHRDLKPENLFVTTHGLIKILDFGVAKLQSSPDESGRTVEDLTTITKSGMVLGTVAYMAPEQLRGKSVDHRSDIFSVGAILYEMLTGRRAFRGETEVDTITAVLRENPPPIDLEQSGIPLPFQQIVHHCLEKEPENRFQSARDLVFALETLSNPSGIQSAQFRPAGLRPSPSSLPWALAALLLVAMLAVVGNQWRENKLPKPAYQRLTFEQGTIYSARFTPDFHSIVYGAAWNQRPLQLFSTVGDSLLTQPLNLTDASLLAISKSGELALTLHGAHGSHLDLEKGTLARAPLAGGSPREILEDVRWADWGSDGELAVVHHTDGRDQIEYPLGHVLYQSNSWISHLRLSPQGDKIAFINHPTLWDDRGSVCVTDNSGRIQVLSPQYDSADGLAWSFDGKEIWFTAAASGYTRSLLAVNAAKNIRTILSIPAGMTLQDMAPDGRVLVSLDAERLAMATSPRAGKSLDISWHDWDIAKDISRDGQSVLFEDASEAAPADYEVAIRRIDGTPPIRLGEGSAGGLSPDGKWAIGILAGSPGRITLYPVGAGQPRAIPVTGLERIHSGSSHFLADGREITVNGNEPGHGVRCYLVDLADGKLRPLTPEGVTGGLVSPDGQEILAYNGPVVAVYPIAGGAPHPIPGLDPEFLPVQWSEDNSAVYGYRSGEMPMKVYKLNLVTGEKTVVQKLQPETTAGLVSISPVVATRDGSRFAYSYYQVFSVLYLISGLR